MASDPAERGSRGGLLSGLRIVLVDDCDDARELIAFTLRRHGAEVKDVGCASDAHDLVVATVPDVLVSDISMPGEDGHMLLRRIRRLPGEPGLTPAIALTAFAEPHDREAASEAGFDLQLSKTVPMAMVIAAVRDLARPRVAARQ